MEEGEVKYVVGCASFSGGIGVWGPFDTLDEANEWGVYNLKHEPDSWEAFPISKPELR